MEGATPTIDYYVDDVTQTPALVDGIPPVARAQGKLRIVPFRGGRVTYRATLRSRTLRGGRNAESYR